MNKKIVSVLLAMCMVLTLLPAIALAADIPVSKVEVTVTAPVAGEKASYEAQVSGENAGDFTVSVGWDGGFDGTSIFQAGQGYTAFVTLAIKGGTGQSFAADNIDAKINGKTAKVESRTNTRLEISYTWYLEVSGGSNNGKAAAEEKKEALYQHDIDMSVLSDYIYGGSKATSGRSYDYGYVKMPEEWTRHDRPTNLPRVGRAVLHIGDMGKDGNVEAAFYPGNPPFNYHKKRLEELDEIGWGPAFGDGVYKFANSNNANTAFYAYTGSEYDVVAYNDKWVAIWDDGGVDTSQGIGNPCGGAVFAQYASWKPGVYFFPRTNCYILDINNQLLEKPKNTVSGTATCPLLIKTTPYADGYVKAGVYKTNQAFPIIDPTPIDGHYKVYYRAGAYYVNASYVNLKLANTAKPAITYTAKVKDGSYDYINIRSEANKNGQSIGRVKNGTVIEIIQKDFDDTYSKIWFNSRECYIDKSFLTSITEIPSAAKTTSPAKGKSKQAAANTQTVYVDLDKYDVLAYNINDNNYFKLRDIAKMLSTSSKRFDIQYNEAKNSIEMLSMFDYTEVGGELTKGDGATRTAQVSSTFLTYDGVPISAACYNIDGNNYFKLRDITDALDCRVEWNNTHQVIQLTTTLPKEDPNEIKG